jgi:hypothetical protein
MVVIERNKILSVAVDILEEDLDSLSLSRLADSSSQLHEDLLVRVPVVNAEVLIY